MTERMLVTEVLLKGETEHHVVPHEEIERLYKTEQLAGIFKYGLYPREEPGEIKEVHTIHGEFLNKDRPTASSVISSAEVDRDGDILKSGGIILTENFLKNPVVLPSHAHTFPVGFDRKIKVASKSVWANWEWLVDIDDTEAATYHRLWEAHVLNCTSVGFIPWEWSESEDLPGWQFDSWEILEHSPVVIGSNRESMRTEGIKNYIRAYGEAVMAGPSPIAKGMWEKGQEIIRPKQVAVGSLFDESAPTQTRAELEPHLVAGASGDPPEPIEEAALKGVIPYKETPKAPEDEAWDGPKEVAAAEISDLKIMATWVDSEEPDVKGSYKLPHHKADGHAVVWRAVSAAMGALLGARGGVDIPDGDRKGVYNHLVKHYIQFDKIPPEFKDYRPDALISFFPESYPELKEILSDTEASSYELIGRILSLWEMGSLSKDEANLFIRALCDIQIKRLETRNEELAAKLEEISAKVIRRYQGR